MFDVIHLNDLQLKEMIDQFIPSIFC